MTGLELAVLAPVLAPTDGTLPRRRHVAAARWAAHAALVRSARASGAALGELRFDERGAPLPTAGWHRSTAHTRGMACAVVAAAPVGIDVERLDRPRAARILTRTLSAAERELLGRDDAAALLGLWTAKEAVLKLAGCGLVELSACRLVAPPIRTADAEEPSTPGADAVWIQHRGAARRVRRWLVDLLGRSAGDPDRATHAVALACDLADFDVVPRRLPPSTTFSPAATEVFA